VASRHHDAIKNDPRWKAVRLLCFERDDWVCQVCGTEDNLQADHRIPLDVLFRDGVTPEAIDLALDLDNLVTLCRSHNASKGARVDIGQHERNDWVHPTVADSIGFLISEPRTAGGTFFGGEEQKSPAASFFTPTTCEKS
jgi:hypothetical protein